MAYDNNPDVIPVVREFFANVMEHQNYKIFVRGKLVRFDSTIKAYYNVQNIGYNQYFFYHNDHLDFDEILSFLTIRNFNIQWK